MSELGTDAVLREEAKRIHGPGAPVDGKSGRELYQALRDLGATALCLSGGGIRSASFALGVIEALAVHPRQEPKGEAARPAASAAASLLAQFNYLSTVSGGGYIGSWLSAWITRAEPGGYAQVWKKLVGRRAHPEVEPSEIAWLRSYSNYLTPSVGLFSADTWAAIALYVRNMILNWIVVLPALCLLLLAVKALAAGLFWLSDVGRPATIAFAVVGPVAMIWALRFLLRNRPSAHPRPVVDRKRERPTTREEAIRDDPHRRESAMVRGAGTGAYVRHCLAPAVAAALLLALYLTGRQNVIQTWNHLGLTTLACLGMGFSIYALAWLVAWPPRQAREWLYWFRDFVSWAAAGAFYGMIVGVGVHVFAIYQPWLLIGNVLHGTPQGFFLLAFVYGVPWIITAQLTAEMIFVGLTSWQPFSDSDREWFARSTGWFAFAAVAWFAVTFLVLIASYLVLSYDWIQYGGSLAAIASGLLGAIGGTSSKSAATEQEARKSGLLNRIALPLAAVIFLVLLALLISALMDYLLLDRSLLESSLLGSGAMTSLCQDVKWMIIGFVVAAVVAGFAWFRVNINRFSTHALYRNRLIRGYLGASNPKRQPDAFTGFDDADNMPMAELRLAEKDHWRPFHVVNIALNVVSSDRLAWQERKAESFTVTPLHCGTGGLGYRPTAEYGGSDPHDKGAGGLSLGTALAISGAAASPNMGYNSSPLVTLLLALFNVRLGWWLGNPGPQGDPDYYRSDGPKIAIEPFITEMFGLTTDDRRYVYLSDGGHFENLGLYEMVRRRCRFIVVSDAGCDPEYGYEDLGNAVRKIAIDLGIYIEFSKLREIKRRSKDNTPVEGAYYALGVIDYKTAPEQQPSLQDDKPPAAGAVENGYILYIKPSYLGSERSPGIVAYAAANAAFPHETTLDQFFSESQFESYRNLGFEMMDTVLTQAQTKVRDIMKARPKESSEPALSPDKLCDLISALAPQR